VTWELCDVAIVGALEEWHHLLKGAQTTISIYTIYKIPKYFMSTQVVNQCQLKWNMPLSRFDFIITHRPSKQQGLSNTLSRRSYFVSKQGQSTYDQQWTILLNPEQFYLQTTTISTIIDSSFFGQVCVLSTIDHFVLNIKESPNNNKEKFQFVVI